jgi:hypothetical protein
MNKNVKVKSIKFDGTELLGVKTEDGRVYMGLNKFLEEIGFKDKANQQYQRNKLVEDATVKMGITTLILTDNIGRDQETFVIELEMIPTAMIKFNPDDLHKKSKALTEQEKISFREKLMKYQAKAKDVLAEEFLGDTETAKEFKEDFTFIEKISELNIKVDTLTSEVTGLNSTIGILVNSATINSYQAKQLNKLVRERISTMLGGAHSKTYKQNSRMYFKNLWLGLTDTFNVSEYRDLNPLNYNDAVTYINNWSMV